MMASVLSRLAQPVPGALAALACGALAVLGFAPFTLVLAPPLAIAGLLAVLQGTSPRAGFWRGWLFGVGLLGCGVFWIRISLNEFGNLAPPIANAMTGVFIAAMALYYGALGWTLRRLDGGPIWAGPLLLLPGLYLLFEWLRGWLFTGFPWLNLGNSQIDGPLAGFVPILGVYGVSLLVALSGGLLWLALLWRGRQRLLASASLAALWLLGSGLQTIDWTEPVGEPFRASLLQANVPQEVKWRPGATLEIAEVYLALTRDHLEADLIVWPETALPEFAHRLREPLLDPLAADAREQGVEIVMGIPVMDEASGRYYNGLLSLGSVEDLYTKQHLVPFGEYLPFKAWLGPIAEWFAVPMSDFSRGTKPRPLLQIGGFTAGASICYEDAFPAEVVAALPDAAFLINVSNDAWFGDSLAPHQHLEIARMRALETGRDLVRATNTGISAIIDHRGRVTATMPSFTRGAVVGSVQPRRGATPFAHAHNWLSLALASAALAAGLIATRASELRRLIVMKIAGGG